MSSQLNQEGNLKYLLISYIVKEQDRELQHIAMYLKVRNRKVAAMGAFDIARKDVLESLVYNAIHNMVILPESAVAVK